MTPTDGAPSRRDPARKARAVRWAIMVGVASMLSMGLVLMFMLTQATNNRALYEENYARLFAVNMVVAVLLFAVLLWIAWRLISRVRRGRFGSRLLVKLAAIFALVGFVPGVLIYVVSYQFVSRSIESWFDVKVETALDAGLNLGRSTLEVMASDLGSRTRAAGAQLSGTSDAAAGLALERIVDQLSADDVVLWNSAGQMVASAGKSRFQLNPERPGAQQLRNVRSQGSIAQIDGLDETGNPMECRAGRAARPPARPGR